MPHLQAPVGPSPLASPNSAVPPGQTSHTDITSLSVADGASFTATLARLDAGNLKIITLPSAVPAVPSENGQAIATVTGAAAPPVKMVGAVVASQPEARSHRQAGRENQDPTSPPDPGGNTNAAAMPAPAPLAAPPPPPPPTGTTIFGTTSPAPSASSSITETSAAPPSHHSPPADPTQTASVADANNTTNPAQHPQPVAAPPSIGGQPAIVTSPPTITSALAIAEPAGITASPSPASTPVSTSSTTSAPVSDQIAPVLLQIATAGGSHQITLHLTPDSLGHVTIAIDQPKNGPVSVTLSAERPETLALLKHDEAQLSQTLDRAGVPSDNRVVSFHLAPAPATSSNQDSTSQGGSNQANTAQTGFGQASFGTNGGSSDDGRRQPTPHAAYSAPPDPDADWNTSPVTAVFAPASRAGLNITA
jgi:flagellar hook-length control protein FliK